MAFPFYGADGTSGTVAVSNGSKNVVGTGTLWLSKNAVPTAGGYAIKMPDGQIYGIDACTGEGALHLVENYNGSEISGGAYYIMPVAAAIGKLLNDVSSLLNSSNFSQLAGLSPNNGDTVQYVAGTWATRTALQSLLSLLNSMSEVNIASASTTDIGASTSPKVQITGTTTITGFGTQANAVRFVRFGGTLTLTFNASSLILPTAANIATAAGDAGIFVSDSSGNWRCMSYTRASGQPIATALSVSTLAVTGLADLSASGAGNVKFPATQNGSADPNTLDDYEEGVFTPLLTIGGSSTGISYSIQSGSYTKLGNSVRFRIRILLSSKGSQTGAVLIGGLPFSNAGFPAPQTFRIGGALASFGLAQGYMGAGATTIVPEKIVSGSVVQLIDTDIGNAVDLMVSGEYQA